MAIETNYFRRHLTFGWWSLLFFLVLGAALETLHGFKVGWYLDVGAETRRLMWTLAHAHGALISLVHLLFAVTLRAVTFEKPKRLRRASVSLIASTFLLPGGFFAAGVVLSVGDPGPGSLVVPIGAVLLFVAVLWTAREIGRRAGKPSTDG